MKKNWQSPLLEVLDLKETMAGPGLRYVDTEQNDPDPEDADHYS
ncbi:paeninodin family lasso peptide [Metabacillus elymi]|uniref:Paeninodin family lasso peptide n=1 Tax=Metabacillus elymi TaxID=2745198 RepID=A0ABX6RYF9_9BACI|nr:paeninodin family lasso peptide [Metabacillus sp. KUDC1714]QNF26181.1 paeninodin family lasso peptide [Metabacillus sp. KUDC1714]